MIVSSLMMILFPIVKKMIRNRRKVQMFINVTIERNGDVESVGETIRIRTDEGNDSEDESVNSAVDSARIYTGPNVAVASPPPTHHHRAQVGTHLLPEGETPPVHVGTHLLAPIPEDESVLDVVC